MKNNGKERKENRKKKKKRSIYKRGGGISTTYSWATSPVNLFAEIILIAVRTSGSSSSAKGNHSMAS